MKNYNKEKRLSKMATLIKSLLDPLYCTLEKIDLKINPACCRSLPKYYRNEDLKKMFGLSSNTIVKYRQEGQLPFTKLGDIFLYDAAKIEKILKDRADGK